MTTPSKAALDLAVKPAGTDWDEFSAYYDKREAPYKIALAYAADLDKADKQNREVLAWLGDGLPSPHALAQARLILRASLLPEPIDPDLLEAREMVKQWHDGEQAVEDYFLKAIKRGRELAKERSV